MAPIEFDVETLKSLRAAQYHRNLKEKREAYNRRLDAKVERRAEREQHKAATPEWPPVRTRSSSLVAPARPPHGAGRAAARTLLAHGDVEAVSDMPSVIAGCTGLHSGSATRKARVAPQLKTTKFTAWRIEEDVDVDELKALLDLPVNKLLDDTIADFNVQAELKAMRQILATEAMGAKELEDAMGDEEARVTATAKTAPMLLSIAERVLSASGRAQILLGSDLQEEDDWELLPVSALAKQVAKEAEDDTWSILA